MSVTELAQSQMAAANYVNPFDGGNIVKAGRGSVADTQIATKELGEIQARVFLAKQFGRDLKTAYDKIMTACQREGLASVAVYSYARGGTNVTGPSIRLAEEIVRDWGNIDCGWMELERNAHESTLRAYAWDLETNTRQSKVFTVKHVRETQNGSKALTSERDIYEMIANQAARRVRTCILALIPGDVIDAALRQCDATLAAQNKGVPVGELVAKLLGAFQEEFEITPDMVAGYVGKNIEAFTNQDVAHLRRVYTSIKEGIVGNDYFLQKMKNAPNLQNKAMNLPPKGKHTADEATEAKNDGYGADAENLPFEMGLDDL